MADCILRDDSRDIDGDTPMVDPGIGCEPHPGDRQEGWFLYTWIESQNLSEKGIVDIAPSQPLRTSHKGDLGGCWGLE